jgi:hypothetical protein
MQDLQAIAHQDELFSRGWHLVQREEWSANQYQACELDTVECHRTAHEGILGERANYWGTVEETSVVVVVEHNVFHRQIVHVVHEELEQILRVCGKGFGLVGLEET